MEVELLACPNCGSELFLATVAGQRLVFRMDAGLNLVLVEGSPEEEAAASGIDRSALRCGACSWRGGAQDLVASHG